MAIGTTRNAFGFYGVHFHASNLFGDHDTFVAGFMRKPWCTGYIPDGIKARYCRFAILIGYNVGSINLYTQSLKTKLFDISNDAYRRNNGIEFLLDSFPTGFDVRRDLTFGTVQLLNHRFLHDFHTLLNKLLLRQRGDFSIFGR